MGGLFAQYIVGDVLVFLVLILAFGVLVAGIFQGLKNRQTARHTITIQSFQALLLVLFPDRATLRFQRGPLFVGREKSIQNLGQIDFGTEVPKKFGTVAAFGEILNHRERSDEFVFRIEGHICQPLKDVVTIDENGELEITEIGVLIADIVLSVLMIGGGVLLLRRKPLGFASALGLLFAASMLFIGSCSRIVPEIRRFTSSSRLPFKEIIYSLKSSCMFVQYSL